MCWLNFEENKECLAACNFLQARLHALAHTSFWSSSPHKGTDVSEGKQSFWPQCLQSPRPPTEVPNARHWKQPINSRKGCGVGHGKAAEKQPEKHPKHTKNCQNSCFSCISALFPAVFRLFYRDPLGTLFGCFPAVFNVGRLAPL